MNYFHVYAAKYDIGNQFVLLKNGQILEPLVLACRNHRGINICSKDPKDLKDRWRCIFRGVDRLENDAHIYTEPSFKTLFYVTCKYVNCLIKVMINTYYMINGSTLIRLSTCRNCQCIISRPGRPKFQNHISYDFGA